MYSLLLLFLLLFGFALIGVAFVRIENGEVATGKTVFVLLFCLLICFIVLFAKIGCDVKRCFDGKYYRQVMEARRAFHVTGEYYKNNAKRGENDC